MSTTAKEQLAARVAAMTEDEARAALEALDNPDGLTSDQRRELSAAWDEAERGDVVPHEEAMATMRAAVDRATRRAVNE